MDGGGYFRTVASIGWLAAIPDCEREDWRREATAKEEEEDRVESAEIPFPFPPCTCASLLCSIPNPPSTDRFNRYVDFEVGAGNNGASGEDFLAPIPEIRSARVVAPDFPLVGPADNPLVVGRCGCESESSSSSVISIVPVLGRSAVVFFVIAASAAGVDGGSGSGAGVGVGLTASAARILSKDPFIESKFVLRLLSIFPNVLCIVPSSYDRSTMIPFDDPSACRSASLSKSSPIDPSSERIS